MIIDVPRSLRERLGDEAVSDFVRMMNDITEKQKVDVVELCVERFERRLAEEGAKIRVSILKWMVTLFIINGIFTAALKFLA